jgi:hypothetical protein
VLAFFPWLWELTIGSARPGVGCGRVGIGVLLAMA